MPTQSFITEDSVLSLNAIIGFCQEFKRHHGVWPAWDAEASAFESAGIYGLSGALLDRILRLGTHGLNNDRSYLEMERLAFANGATALDLSFIDPRHSRKIDEIALQDLVRSMVVVGRDHGGRHESGAVESMWVDVHNAAINAPGQVRVPVTESLKSYIDRVGMIYGTADVPNSYFLSLGADGRLYLKYQAIIGSRFVGTVSSGEMDSLRHRLGAPLAEDQVTIASKVSGLSQTLEQEMRTLILKGDRIALPSGRLTHYDEIKRRIVNAGGRYLTGKSQFAFERGIDVADVYGRLVTGESVNFQQEYQFFATPSEQGMQMVSDLISNVGPLVGKRVLEPSAGDGALADLARAAGARVVTVEEWNVNAIKLRDKGHEVIERDFLQVTPAETGLFDCILANPPFTGNQDIDHVMHMFNFVEDGGAMSVIMSTGWVTGTSTKHRQFREFLAEQNVTISEIAAGAFKASGTSVPTMKLQFTDCQNPQMTSIAAWTPDEVPEQVMSPAG